MDDAANTPVPYRPSNAGEGVWFESLFCNNCTRDDWASGGDGCSIQTDALAFNETDPSYPKEWIEDADGPRCTAFTPALPPRNRSA